LICKSCCADKDRDGTLLIYNKFFHSSFDKEVFCGLKRQRTGKFGEGVQILSCETKNLLKFSDLYPGMDLLMSFDVEF